MRRSRILLVCLLTGAASGTMCGLLGDRPAARAAQDRGPDCLVARLGDVEIRRRDADELAGLVSPAPAPAEAARLAVDAALAHWIRHGELSLSSAPRWLASYRNFLAELATSASTPTEIGRRAMARLDRAAAALHLTTGPCYAPLSSRQPSWGRRSSRPSSPTRSRGRSM